MSANFLTKDLVLWTAVYALLLERRVAPGLVARMRQSRYHDSFWLDEARRCVFACIANGRKSIPCHAPTVAKPTRLSVVAICYHAYCSLDGVFRNCSDAKAKFTSAKEEGQAANTAWATAARHFHMVHA